MITQLQVFDGTVVPKELGTTAIVRTTKNTWRLCKWKIQHGAYRGGWYDDRDRAVRDVDFWIELRDEDFKG